MRLVGDAKWATYQTEDAAGARRARPADAVQPLIEVTDVYGMFVVEALEAAEVW
ncbi:MAG: hypothetical protein R3F59_11970 [Myxococcota bacterium]